MDVEDQPSRPAAAVSRQWFDQRRPDVTSVSAPSASAAPTRNSRFRSLFPPNASGSEVLALDPDLDAAARAPPENRGRALRAAASSVDQPEAGQRGDHRTGRPVQVRTSAHRSPVLRCRDMPMSDGESARLRSAVRLSVAAVGFSPGGQR